MRRKIYVMMALAFIIGFVFMSFSSASDFPTKPIEVLAPYGLGGQQGMSLKILGDIIYSRKLLSQPILVIQALGAGGMVAGAQAARAKADGYTLLGVNSGTNVIALHTRKDVPYKNSDFEFLAQYAALDLALAVGGKTPFKTLEEFIEYARKNPFALKSASSGIGTTGNLCFELFKLKAGGLKIDNVPFKSSTEYRAAIYAGHCDVGFVYGGTGGPGDEIIQTLERGGRILAVATKERLKRYPQVPTFVEKGMDIVFSSWYGIGSPRGMPREVSERLKDIFYKILQDQEIIDIIEKKIGFRYEFRKSEEFTIFVKEFEDKVQMIVKEAKIPLN